MLFISWLSNVRRSLARRSRGSFQQRRASIADQMRIPSSRRVAPEVEVFEKRRLLTGAEPTVTFVVNTVNDTPDANVGDGMAQDGSGNTSLRAAIQEANVVASGHVVVELQAGFFDLTRSGAGEDSAATGDLDITNTGIRLIVRGQGATETFIRPNGLDRAFDLFASTDVLLEDVSLFGGQVAGDGGAVRNAGRLELVRTEVFGSSASDGMGGSLFRGGGIFNTGNLTVLASEIESNRADGDGAGIYNLGTAEIDATIISDNSSNETTNGGGIYNAAIATLKLTRSLLQQNVATAGGGLFNDGNALVDHSTFAFNLGSDTGAILANSGSLTLASSTISQNSAPDANAGGVTRIAGQAVVQNTIIAGNLSGDDVVGTFVSQGYNLIGIESGNGFSQTGDQTGTSAAPLDPLLLSLANNGGPTATFLPDTASPVIDTGFVAGTDDPLRPPTDQRGAPITTSAQDIGAVETDFAGFFVNTFEDTVDANVNDGVAADASGNTSLRAAIQQSNFSGGFQSVIVLPGVFRITLAGEDDNAAAGDLDVAGATQLIGFGPQASIIDAGGLDRVLDVFGFENTIRGLTLRAGDVATMSGGGIQPTRSGGGLRNLGSSTVLVDVHVTDNAAHTHGGISNQSFSGFVLDNVLIARNTAIAEGGGFGNAFSSSATLVNSTVTHNTAGTDGGGISNEPLSFLTLQNSTISFNQASGDGGGIGSIGSVVVVDSRISQNTAQGDGGGIGISAEAGSIGTAQILRSTVNLNTATNGGGIGLDAGGLSLVASFVQDNTASVSGGGIGITGTATADMRFSDLSGNSAATGGGIANDGASVFVSRSAIVVNDASTGGGIAVINGLTVVGDSTVSDNTAGTEGGGIHIAAGSAILENSTITANTADTGGGVFSSSSLTSTVVNTIIAGNSALVADADISATTPLNSDGNNLIGTGGPGFTNGVDGDQVGTPGAPLNPQLGALAFNGGTTRTHALLAGSPAIDAGGSQHITETEQRGSSRVLNGGISETIDIGAFEFGFTGFFVNTTADTTDANPGDGIARDANGQTSLRAAIQEANALAGTQEIVLVAGAYQLSRTGAVENGGVTGDLDIMDSLLIRGAGVEVTSIDGLDSDRVFDVFPGVTFTLNDVLIENGNVAEVLGNGGGLQADGATVTLNRIHLRNNDADAAGGAIFTQNTALTINSALITSNEAQEGGGVYQLNGALAVNDSVVDSNQAGTGDGGGLWIGGSDATIERTFVQFNRATAGVGGGLHIEQVGPQTRTVSLNGSVVGSNTSNLGGGGVSVVGENVSIINTSVVNNQNFGGIGGGILNDGGTLTVQGSTIRQNFAFDGGGLASSGVGAQLTVENSQFEFNAASNTGGAIFNSGTADVFGTTFLQNSVSGSGGGIENRNVLDLLNNTFSSNFANSSGGGLNATGSANTTLLNNTFTNNQAGIGGGIANAGQITLQNTIVAGNTAFNFDADVSGSFTSNGFNLIGDRHFTTDFQNGVNGDIVGGVTSTPISGASNTNPIRITANGHGLVTGDRVRVSGVTGNTSANGTFLVTVINANEFDLDSSFGNGTYAGGGSVTQLVDPRLGPLQNNTTVSPLIPGMPPIVGSSLPTGPVVTTTHAVLSGSPALDAGTNTGAPSTDQRGFARPIDGDGNSTATTDIGAFELFHTTVTGRLFDDLNGDGLFDPSEESGITDRFIYLDANGNGQYDDGEPFAQTRFDDFMTPGVDEAGTYVLELVPPGVNVIALLPETGTRQTFRFDPLFGTPDSVHRGVGNPQAMASGDFDKDGFVDFVVGDSVNARVTVVYNSSGGFGFETPIHFAVGSTPKDILPIDLNSDDLLDLVVVNRESDNVTILLNLGDGDFTIAQTVGVGDLPVSVAAADFNQDSFLDLAVANSGSNDVTLLAGSMSGSFSSAGTLTVGTNPNAIVTTDINLDGVPDLATADGNSQQLTLLINDGLGFSFNASVVPVAGPASLITEDFDRDGDPDFVVGSPVSGDVRMVRNIANNFFEVTVIGQAPSAASLSVADIDADGNPDLLAGNNSTVGTITAFRNLGGAAGFSPGIEFSTGTQEPSDIAVADFTGDNRPDVLTASIFNSEVTLLRNLTGGHAVTAATATPVTGIDFGSQTLSSIEGFAFDDLNNNGFQDVGEPGTPNISLFLDMNGNGRQDPFEPVTGTNADDPATEFDDESGTYRFENVIPGNYFVRQYAPSGAITTSPRLIAFSAQQVAAEGQFAVDSESFDVDGNGTLDMVVLYRGNGTSFIDILLGDGTGRLAPAGVAVNLGSGAVEFEAADLDGDDDLDLVVIDDVQNTLTIVENTGSGFIARTPLAAADNPSALAVGDINGDLNPDIVVGKSGSASGAQSVAIYRNQGNLAFGSPTFLTTGGSVGSVALARLDNTDLDLDLIAVNADAQQNFLVFANDGLGGFSLAATVATDEIAVASFGALAVGDTSINGLPDVLIATTGGNVYEYQNLGNLTFDSGQLVLNAPVRHITLVDVDTGHRLVEDFERLLDLVVTTTTGEVQIAQGFFGTFSLEVTLPNVGANPGGLSAGDFDGDGIVDLAVVDNSATAREFVVFNRIGSAPVETFAGDTGFTAPFGNVQAATVQGVVFDDIDGNGRQDAGENGLPNVTVFADFNENTRLDTFEPSAVTAADGSFTIEGVEPRKEHVIRQVVPVNQTPTALIRPQLRLANELDIVGGTRTPTVTDSVVVHDLNFDAFFDIVAINPGTSGVTVLFNSANGVFTPLELTTTSVPVAVRVGQINSDSTIDVVTANADGTVSIFLNDGFGVFQTERVVSTGLTGLLSLELLDLNPFDSLGVNDIAVTSSTTGNVRLLANNGTVGFTETTAVISGATRGNDIVAADFDFDGDPDLATIDSSTNRVYVALNQGTGTFGAATAVTVGQGPISLAAADLDLGGTIDLIVSNAGSQSVQVLTNNGSGVFTAQTAIPLSAAPGAVAAGIEAINSDGMVLPVIVVTHSNETFATLLLDLDFSGNFVSQTIEVGPADSVTLENISGSIAVDGIASDPTTGNVVIYENETGPDDFTYGIFPYAGETLQGFAFGNMSAAVNAGPSISTPSPQTTNEDVTVVFTSSNGNAITISDPDAGTNEVEVTLAVTSGRLTLSQTSNLTFDSGDGVDDVSMVFRGSISSINTALDGLSFAPNGNFNGQSTLSVMVDDLGNTGAGGSQTASANVTINVAAINDAPSIGVPAAQTVNEDGSLVFSSANGNAITVSDVDAGVNSVQLTLSTTNGLLTLGAMTGLTFTTGDGTNDSSMTFTGTIANINAALNGLRFTPNGNFTGNSPLSLSLNDQGQSGSGGAQTANANVGITVSAVNDAPTISVPGPQAVNEDTNLFFTTSSGNAISVADIDAGASSVELVISATNAVLTLSGTTGLTFTSGDGTSDASMTFSGSVANINAALNGTRFRSNSNFAGSSTVSLSLSDLGNSGSGGAQTANASVAVTVTGVNDAPALSGIEPNALDYTEAGTSTVTSTLTVSDVDSANLQSATVSISSNFRPTEDELSANPSGTSIAVNFNNTTGILTLTGSDTVANYQQVLRSVTYLNTSGDPDTALRGVSFAVNDGALGSNTATRNISLTPINDPPVIDPSQPMTFSTDEHTTAGTLIHTVVFSDVDSSAGELSIAITSGNDNSAFSIDSSGRITVNNPDALDFEQRDFEGNPSFVLEITVTDSSPNDPTPLTASAFFTINLNDIAESFVIGANEFSAAAVGSIRLVLDSGLLRAVDSNSVDMVPPAAFANVTDVIVTAQDNEFNDTLILDYSGGNPVPAAFTFTGGTGSDRLILINGAFTTVKHALNEADTGSIDLDGQTLTLNGVEQRVDLLDVADREFRMSSTVRSIRLTDDANRNDAVSVIALPDNSAVVRFQQTTGEIDIIGTDFADVIVLLTVDGQFASNVTVNAAGQADIVGASAFAAANSQSPLNVTVLGGDGDDTLVGGNGSFDLRGEAGNDSFEVVGITGNGSVDGGAGIDTVREGGSTVDFVSLTQTGAAGGTLVAGAGSATQTVGLANLERLLDDRPATTRTVTFPNLAQTITVADDSANADQIQLNSQGFEVHIRVPSNQLNLIGGSADDNFQLNSLDASFQGGLTIDAGLGTDLIDVNVSVPQPGLTGAIMLSAEEVEVGGAISTSGEITVNGAVTLVAPTTIVAAGTTVNGAVTGATNAIDVTGPATINGGLQLGSGSRLRGAANVTGGATLVDVTIDGPAFVTGPTTVQGTVTLNSTANFTSVVTVAGTLLVPNGALTLGGGATLANGIIDATIGTTLGTGDTQHPITLSGAGAIRGGPLTVTPGTIINPGSASVGPGSVGGGPVGGGTVGGGTAGGQVTPSSPVPGVPPNAIALPTTVLAGGSTLALDLTSDVPADQILIVGTFEPGNATLAPVLREPVTPGQSFVIVSNDENEQAGSDLFGSAADSGAGSSIGSSASLTSGSGDGTAQVTVDAFGNFSQGMFDPVGSGAAADAIFASGVFIRQEGSTARQQLNSVATNASTIRGTADEANSSFRIGNLQFTLVQTVRPVFDGQGAPNGTILTQTYRVTNVGPTSASFELVRYLDGDLGFDGSIIDGGGRLVTSTGEEVLFETDSGNIGAANSTFVGITGQGGTRPGSGRFEIDSFSGLRSRIQAGTALDGIITGDADGDQIIDIGSEYDVTLGLLNLFDLAAGESGEYTTHTLFATGLPEGTIEAGLTRFTGLGEGSGLDVPILNAQNQQVGVQRFVITYQGGDGNDIELRPVSAITGSVWDDLNANGTREQNEPGLGGVTVSVVDPQTSEVLSTTITNGTGQYTVSDLLAGTYQILFTAPDGRHFTLRDVGENDLIDSDAGVLSGLSSEVTLSTGVTISNVDAGLIQTTVSIRDAQPRPEGNNGQITLHEFMVELNGRASHPVSVLIQAQVGNGGTGLAIATPGQDFGPLPGGTFLLTFQPGQTRLPVQVPVFGDNVAEGNEAFEVRLVSATQANIADGIAVGTILNDDVSEPTVVLVPGAQVVEANPPNRPVLNFTVQLLGGAIAQDVTVTYTTVNPDGSAPPNAATPGVDFEAISGTVVIPAGQTEALIRVAVISDRDIEPDEVLDVQLTAVTNAVLGSSTRVTGTIINDDLATPTLSIGPTNRSEQDAPLRPVLEFPVRLNAISTTDITVTYSTLNLTGLGFATPGVDFEPITNGTLVIPRGRLDGVIRVAIIGDNDPETDETVAVELTSFTGNALLGESLGVGVIRNDDVDTPQVSLNPGPQTPEGRAGRFTPLIYTLSLNGTTDTDVEVIVSTVDINAPGFATAGVDYRPFVNRSVIIPRGSLSGFVIVDVLGDEGIENDERVLLRIVSASANVVVDPLRSESVATIVNDDRAQATVTLQGGTVLESDDPRTTVANFIARLDSPATDFITLRYRTLPSLPGEGFATDDVDFRSVADGMVLITPGQIFVPISIIVNGDRDIEGPEDLFVELISADGPAFIDPFASLAAVTIFDNDIATPAVTVRSLGPVLETDNPQNTAAQLVVELSGPAATDITVNYTTLTGNLARLGSATAGVDFAPVANGQVVIPAGQVQATFGVPVLGDGDIEGDERFVVMLTGVSTGAMLGIEGTQAVVTISDNDFDLPLLNISDAIVSEGDPGEDVDLVFTVSLAGPIPNATVMVELQTSSAAGAGLATDDPDDPARDYFRTRRVLFFDPTVTSQEFRVRLQPDDRFEGNEQFFITVIDSLNVALRPGVIQAVGTILNDDAPQPLLSIQNARVLEGDSPDESVLEFQVILDADPETTTSQIQVDFRTIDISAVAGTDYRPTQGTLTFGLNERSKTVQVSILGNLLDEIPKELLVELLNPVNAQLNPAAFQGLGLIENDDSPNVTFRIDSVTRREGNSGTSAFDFTVTKVGKSNSNVSVAAATSSGTASAGSDFQTATTSLTFTPGGPVRQTISIQVFGDDDLEAELETFFVTLSNAVGGTVDPLFAQGVGTILNDDQTVFREDGDAQLLLIAQAIQDAINRLGNDPDNPELLDLISDLSRLVLQRLGLTSGLVFVTDPVDFLLTDTQGRTTGYNRSAGEITETSRSYYSGDGIVELVVMPTAPSGIYGLQLSGVGSGEFRTAATLITDSGFTRTIANASTLTGNTQLALDFTDPAQQPFPQRPNVFANLAEDALNGAARQAGRPNELALSQEAAAAQAFAMLDTGYLDAVAESQVTPTPIGIFWNQLRSSLVEMGQSFDQLLGGGVSESLKALGRMRRLDLPAEEAAAEDTQAVDRFWRRFGKTLLGTPGLLLDLIELIDAPSEEDAKPADEKPAPQKDPAQPKPADNATQQNNANAANATATRTVALHQASESAHSANREHRWRFGRGKTPTPWNTGISLHSKSWPWAVPPNQCARQPSAGESVKSADVAPEMKRSEGTPDNAPVTQRSAS